MVRIEHRLAAGILGASLAGEALAQESSEDHETPYEQLAERAPDDAVAFRDFVEQSTTIWHSDLLESEEVPMFESRVAAVAVLFKHGEANQHGEIKEVVPLLTDMFQDHGNIPTADFIQYTSADYNVARQLAALSDDEALKQQAETRAHILARILAEKYVEMGGDKNMEIAYTYYQTNGYETEAKKVVADMLKQIAFDLNELFDHLSPAAQPLDTTTDTFPLKDKEYFSNLDRERRLETASHILDRYKLDYWATKLQPVEIAPILQELYSQHPDWEQIIHEYLLKVETNPEQ